MTITLGDSWVRTHVEPEASLYFFSSDFWTTRLNLARASGYDITVLEINNGGPFQITDDNGTSARAAYVMTYTARKDARNAEKEIYILQSGEKDWTRNAASHFSRLVKTSVQPRPDDQTTTHDGDTAVIRNAAHLATASNSERGAPQNSMDCGEDDMPL